MTVRTLTDYENDTIAILRELTQDWDTGLAQDLNSETAVAADLEFDSLDVVHMITSIQQHYGRNDFRFEELLMVDGRYVPDLTVAQIARFVQGHLAQKQD